MKLDETERLLAALMESEVLQLAEVGLGVGVLLAVRPTTSSETHEAFMCVSVTYTHMHT